MELKIDKRFIKTFFPDEKNEQSDRVKCMQQLLSQSKRLGTKGANHGPSELCLVSVFTSSVHPLSTFKTSLTTQPCLVWNSLSRSG